MVFDPIPPVASQICYLRCRASTRIKTIAKLGAVCDNLSVLLDSDLCKWCIECRKNNTTEMPSGEVTLQRIQREIYEVKLREEELRKKYANGDGGNSGDGSDGDISLTNGNGVSSPPPMTNGNPPRASVPLHINRSMSDDITLNLTKTKVSRRFAPNTKGVMQRFIKSKGKLAALTTLTNTSTSNAWNSAPSMEETISPPKVTLEPGKQLRRGYVPVEERMKKEFQEMHHRESELKLERRKSQSDLLSMDEDGASKQVETASQMRTARSVSHLSEGNDYPDDTQSEPCSLKPARSLAQLCDTEEDLDAPGSLTLIRQWESLIQKNQQLRT